MSTHAVSDSSASTVPNTPDRLATIRGLSRHRNFSLLWIGQAVSVLGDQFYMIALPWLVLRLTGDALAVGSVLALAGIPRALFMLVGGAITDRFSPRNVMIVSNVFRLALVGLLAWLVFTNAAALWMLYLLALTFGLADAFSYPAANAIVPRIINKEQFSIANALIQGTIQVSIFLGPAVAGILIALLDSGAAIGEAVEGGTVSTQGIALAFAFDAATFLFSALTLAWIRLGERSAIATAGAAESVLGAIRVGLVHVWQDIPVRSFFLLIAAANFLLTGPLIVGVPVLAATRLPEGAAAFGILMSAQGGGMLLGTVLAGLLPRPPARTMGITLGVIWSLRGLGAAVMGVLGATPSLAFVIFLMGLADGYVSILFMTWLQIRTPSAMMGRIMSVFMVVTAGLTPVSTALSGAIINWNLTAAFVGGGVLMTVLVWASISNPHMRAMEEGEIGTAVLTEAGHS